MAARDEVRPVVRPTGVERNPMVDSEVLELPGARARLAVEAAASSFRRAHVRDRDAAGYSVERRATVRMAYPVVVLRELLRVLRLVRAHVRTPRFRVLVRHRDYCIARGTPSRGGLRFPLMHEQPRHATLLVRTCCINCAPISSQ